MYCSTCNKEVADVGLHTNGMCDACFKDDCEGGQEQALAMLDNMNKYGTIDKPARIHLSQTLCCKNDSFTYKNMDGTGPVYVVDSNGTLSKDGTRIGKFKLGDNQWHLYLNDELYMSGPVNGLFQLPEFELKALTELVNGVRK